MSTVHFQKYQDINYEAAQVYMQHEEKIMRVLWFIKDIQHIGSTAIPGSVTKGDVDLNVRVEVKDFEKAKEQLEELYEKNQVENWVPSNFASFKDDSGTIPVGVQLTTIGSKYDDFVKLRDLLIDNPNLLEEYNQMKLKYEDKDMEEYRKEKAAFFEKLRRHFKYFKVMNVTIKQALIKEKSLIKKLMKPYFDELSKFFEEGINADEYKYLDLYWTESDRAPFLVYMDNILCGFVLVNSHLRIPQNKGARAIAEFFVLKKYRDRGVGKIVAFDIFNKFPGKWEVAVAKENIIALKFWEKVINEYTERNFSKVILDDENWKGPVYSLSSKNDSNH